MLDVEDLDKIRGIIKETMDTSLIFMQGQITRNTQDIDKNNTEINALNTKQEVSEVYVKSLYKRFDWKGWIAVISVLIASATIVGR